MKVAHSGSSLEEHPFQIPTRGTPSGGYVATPIGPATVELFRLDPRLEVRSRGLEL